MIKMQNSNIKQTIAVSSYIILPLDPEEKNNEKISMINQNIKAPISLASNIEINKALRQ